MGAVFDSDVLLPLCTEHFKDVFDEIKICKTPQLSREPYILSSMPISTEILIIFHGQF